MSVSSLGCQILLALQVFDPNSILNIFNVFRAVTKNPPKVASYQPSGGVSVGSFRSACFGADGSSRLCLSLES